MKTANFRYVSCRTLEHNDVVYAEFPFPITVTLEVAKELVANRMTFTENQPHYAILDLSNVVHVTSEANDFMKDPNGGMKNLLATAFLASNPVSALIANFFVRVPKDFPTRYFSSQKEAVRWVLAYRASRIS